jgi:hypothetical protein
MHCFTFSALGHDTPLFRAPVAEPRSTDIARAANLPVPITTWMLERDAPAGAGRAEADPALYGPDTASSSKPPTGRDTGHRRALPPIRQSHRTTSFRRRRSFQPTSPTGATRFRKGTSPSIRSAAGSPFPCRSHRDVK